MASLRPRVSPHLLAIGLCAALAACSDPAGTSLGSGGGGSPSTGGTQDPARDGGAGAPRAIDGGAPSNGADAAPPADTDASAPAPDAPPASAGCSGAALCDDFEGDAVGGAPNAARWSIATPSCSGTGAIAIDGSVAHSGARSVKVTGAGGYCNHVFLANSAAVAAVGAHLFARFFVRLDSALGDGHVTFLAMKDASEGKDLRMGGQNKVLMWNRESDDATLPAMSPAGTAKSVVPATARWTCVELEVDGAQGTLHTWVDGAAIEGLIEDGTATPDVDAQWLSRAGWRPSVTDLRLGWESYGGQSETLWFDDVAVGASRIGCGS